MKITVGLNRNKNVCSKCCSDGHISLKSSKVNSQGNTKGNSETPMILKDSSSWCLDCLYTISRQPVQKLWRYFGLEKRGAPNQQSYLSRLRVHAASKKKSDIFFNLLPQISSPCSFVSVHVFSACSLLQLLNS